MFEYWRYNLMIQLCELDINKFDTLQKIIQYLESCDHILIKNGVINHYVNTTIVSINLTEMLGDDFNLDIINPKKYSKLFKSMTRKNIKLYDDSDMSRYIISNNEVKLFLPKKVKSDEDGILKLDKLEPIGSPITIKDNKKSIKTFIGSNEVKLLIHNNQLKGLLVDEVGIYQFPEYENDEFQESDCEMLVSYGFLNIDSSEYLIQLGKDKVGKYWIVTTVTFDSNVNLLSMENVCTKNIDNLLI